MVGVEKKEKEEFAAPLRDRRSSSSLRSLCFIPLSLTLWSPPLFLSSPRDECISAFPSLDDTGAGNAARSKRRREIVESKFLMPLFFWRASNSTQSSSAMNPSRSFFFLAFPRPHAIESRHQHRQRVDIHRLELAGGRAEMVFRGSEAREKKSIHSKERKSENRLQSSSIFSRSGSSSSSPRLGSIFTPRPRNRSLERDHQK